MNYRLIPLALTLPIFVSLLLTIHAAQRVSAAKPSATRVISGEARYTNVGYLAPGLLVELFLQQSRRRLRMAKTDSRGRFQFRSVPPGRYMLKYGGSNHYCRGTQDVNTVRKSRTGVLLITESCG